MSTTRRLVQRGHQNEESSPVPPNRQRRQETEANPVPIPLPPYEPPSCPLSASAQKAIDNLRVKYDFSKYKKHLTGAIDAITTAAADNNERLAMHQTAVQRHAESRKSKDIPEDQKPEHHVEEEQYTNGLERQVSDLTAKAEKALRELIDYGDELSMQDSFMRELSEYLAAAPAARPAARRRRRDPHDEEEEEEEPQDENAPAANENLFSAVELLKEAKEEHTRKYTAKSMRARYGDHNEYRNFKRTVHDALHPGDNQPPVPHASTWFPEEESNASAGARRRRNNTTDNTNNDDDSGDEIEMTGVTFNMKCPLTLQTFTEPYSNSVCRHTFEKRALLEYFNGAATVFNPPGQSRGRGQPSQGIRQAKCPQTGCEKWFQLKDFFDDQLIIRKLQRMQKAAAQVDDDDDDDDEDDARPRGTQRNRPTQIDDDSDEGVSIQEEPRKAIKKMKREKQSVMKVASSEPSGEEVDAMDTD